MIKYTCPHCSSYMNIIERYAGCSGSCSQCGQAITVPGPPPNIGVSNHFQAIGTNGQIDICGDKVCIRRNTFFSLFTQRVKFEKEIFISSITSVQFKKAGFFLGYGYMRIGITGGGETKRGFLEDLADENTIQFYANKQLDFERIKEAIEKQMPEGCTASPNLSDADELSKFAQLRDRGILSEEEFQRKKEQILGL